MTYKESDIVDGFTFKWQGHVFEVSDLKPNGVISIRAFYRSGEVTFIKNCNTQRRIAMYLNERTYTKCDATSKPKPIELKSKFGLII